MWMILSMIMRKTLILMMSDKSLIHPKWDVPSHIKAIQTSRLSGVSKHSYSSFNLSYSVGDDPELVSQNLALLRANLPSEINWLNQIHENKVVQLPHTGNIITADASYTKKKDIVCAVRTADCLPILLTDQEGSFVSAIHAGWRSLASGIIENTLIAIKSKYQIIAWLGPSISQDYYEVGQEVFDIFKKYDSMSVLGFESAPNNKYWLSLTKIAMHKLAKIGVKKIFGSGLDESFCTFKNKDQFYSHRRDGVTGRMASLIWMDID
mgnify:CR=1 FL=1